MRVTLGLWLLTSGLSGCRPPASPDPMHEWRPLIDTYFAAGETDRAVCVARHESGGNPNTAFDEWAHWWQTHPDTPRTDDWPRPPRDMILGRGGDSRYSVGLYQINVCNLAGNRIEGLQRWIPPNIPAMVRGPTGGRPWAEYWFPVSEAHAVLLDPENNVAAAARIQRLSGWLPAWNADKTACGLS